MPDTARCNLDSAAAVQADCLTSMYMEQVFMAVSGRLELWVQILALAGALSFAWGFGLCLWLVFRRPDFDDLII
jgi:hypothetical protein